MNFLEAVTKGVDSARLHLKMPRMEDAPPLYKPELIEPKKRLSILQRCYKEPWVPIGQRTGQSAPACTRHPLPRPVSLRLGVSYPWQAV